MRWGPGDLAAREEPRRPGAPQPLSCTGGRRRPWRGRGYAAQSQSASAGARRGVARAARQPLGPRFNGIKAGMNRASAGAAPVPSEQRVRTAPLRCLATGARIEAEPLKEWRRPNAGPSVSQNTILHAEKNCSLHTLPALISWRPARVGNLNQQGPSPFTVKQS